MADKRIKVGDKVRCRYFNEPIRKFYGPFWTGTVTMIIDHTSGKDYTVKRESGTVVTLQRKEIKLILARHGEGS